MQKGGTFKNCVGMWTAFLFKTILMTPPTQSNTALMTIQCRKFLCQWSCIVQTKITLGRDLVHRKNQDFNMIKQRLSTVSTTSHHGPVVALPQTGVSVGVQPLTLLGNPNPKTKISTIFNREMCIIDGSNIILAMSVLKQVNQSPKNIDVRT